MIKIRIVEIQPPPYFQAAAPARIERNGPSIHILLVFADHSTMKLCYAAPAAFCSCLAFPCGLKLNGPSRTQRMKWLLHVIGTVLKIFSPVRKKDANTRGSRAGLSVKLPFHGILFKEF